MPSVSEEVMMASNVVGGGARRAGREVTGSRWFHRMSRAGLVAHGVMYLLVGWIAVQIGLGDGGREADKSGALQTVAEQPAGKFLLWLLAVGFAGLALYCLAEAAFGQPIPEGHKPRKRLSSLGRAVLYVVACAGIVSFVMGRGSSSSDDQSRSFTGRAMAEPGGRWLVMAIGLAFVAWGVYAISSAVRRKFMKILRTGQMSAHTRRVVQALGVVGGVARGLVACGIGAFLVYAALSADSDKAKGLDGTLREFASTPAGPWLLVAVAVGLLTYGVYAFAEARYRKVEAVR
ncbi:DUF1206 domain-containing protein [Actinomadura kijaniata]|uniref:DUF1206 domain-containing protein n=1 Tax=Actinomadura kijaniata TaxID=46161 RepID=UPI001FE1A913|nr:DUF1206 domain-containing protein [Actinomadura kijaniata]